MADKKAVVFALNKLQVSHLTVAFTHAINLESDDRDWINESEIKNIVATVSTPFHLILRSQSPFKRAKARHGAQGIAVDIWPLLTSLRTLYQVKWGTSFDRSCVFEGTHSF